MKTSNKITLAITIIFGLLLIIWFVKLKNNDLPHDYHKVKMPQPDFSTIVAEGQRNLYIQSGDSTYIEFRHWGEKQKVEDDFFVRNDTLFIHCKLDDSSSSLHITGKNVRKIIAKNKSYVLINKFASGNLKIEADKSHIQFINQNNNENDSTRYVLNVNFSLGNKSRLSITKSDIQNVKITANNSNVILNESTFGSAAIDLKSRSDYWETGKNIFNKRLKFKSDNSSNYTIRVNKHVKEN